MIQSEENQLFHSFMYLSKINSRKTHLHLEDLGLYRGQPVLLYQLLDQDGLSGRELADRMDVTPVTITKMVRRLKDAGFVTTKPDPKDSRISRVYLTPKAKDIHPDLVAIYRGLESTLLNGFSIDERQTLADYIQRMTANITNTTQEEGPLND